jgi:hypothetical protein
MDFTTSQSVSDNQQKQREKQIDIGKKTREYIFYIECIPKHLRKKKWRNSWHPQTPDYKEKRSTRSFQGLIKCWRRCLHNWGNLSPEVYAFIKENPTLNPLEAIEIVNRQNNHKESAKYALKEHSCCYTPPLNLKHTLPELFSIPPITFSEAVKGLNKCSGLLNASSDSIKKSEEIARNLVFCDAISFFQENTCIREHPVNKTLSICSKEATAFIPSTFSSLQIWPQCQYLREVDLYNKFCNNDFISRLKMYQHEFPLESLTVFGTKLSEAYSNALHNDFSKLMYESVPSLYTSSKTNKLRYLHHGRKPAERVMLPQSFRREQARIILRPMSSDWTQESPITIETSPACGLSEYFLMYSGRRRF